MHIADGFNRLMGENWREYWAQYADDCLVFTATEEQCRHRQRMLTIAFRVLGKEVLSKIDRTFRKDSWDEVHERRSSTGR